LDDFVLCGVEESMWEKAGLGGQAGTAEQTKRE